MIERLKHALEGRYRLDREVGSGGMAVVYVAEDLKHGRRVALKVLRPEVGHELGADRFLREIRIAAGLSHPNILPLFDSGEADGLLYYVMPYVEGETLRDRLTREGALPVEDAVRLAGEIAGALARAHAAGVVHRDIKPENVLIESGHALVADFGVARALDAAGGDRLTRTGVAIGTPAYMSPEQIAGEAGDARSDVYSLGCVAYEMLAGKPPFAARTAQAVVAGHLAGDVPSLREGRPDVPPGLEGAIERALAKEPSARFDTATELAEQLTASITLQARAAHERSERRKRRLGAALTVLAVGLAGLGIWWGAQRAAAPAIETLAVLPASNLTRDPEHNYFVDGVHEALVLELQRAGIAVWGRQSVLRYRGSDRPIAEIADELGVDALLQLVVGREGDSVRVDVSLYARDSHMAMWSDSFSESIEGVLGLYRDVSARIAAALGTVLSPSAEARLAERPTVDPQVYELVLRGEHHRRLFTPPNFALARRFFERAMALDSNYAPAYLGLAMVWSSMSAGTMISADSARSVAGPLLARARALDADLADAHYLTPGVIFWGEWDWEGGFAAYERALELDPNNAETHAFYAQALTFHGRWRESEEHRLRALELDALNPFVIGLVGYPLLASGRFQEAIAMYEQLFASNPGAGLGEAPLRGALIQVGRGEDALAVTRAFHTARRDAEVVAAMDAGLSAGGAREAWARAAAVLAARDSHPELIRTATYYAAAEDWESTLTWIRRVYEERHSNAPVIGGLPSLWPLHEDPRFREIVEAMGLPLLQGDLG